MTLVDWLKYRTDLLAVAVRARFAAEPPGTEADPTLRDLKIGTHCGQVIAGDIERNTPLQSDLPGEVGKLADKIFERACVTLYG